MDKSKIFQPSHEYNLGNGAISVNIYNGRFLYNYPLTSIGAGNFKINVDLIYNSFYKKNDFVTSKLGFGNGWKFLFEQFILKYKEDYNIDGFELGDYVYIDSKWCIHRFVKYKQCEGYNNAGTIYYDESGTGLKLIVRPNLNYQIIDEKNNLYYFERNSGKLISIISGVNSLIIKNIEYDENYENVISIYDSRKNKNRIFFDYNENNLPIKVYSSNSKIYYKLEYSDLKLLKIFKGNIKNIKQIHEFRYTNSCIDYIINSEDLQALQLKYTYNNTNYLLEKISFGSMKEDIQTKKWAAETNCGEDLYLGEGIYVGNSGKVFVNSNLVMPSEYIYSTIKYTYQNAYTELINFKNIKTRYYFDINGRLISSLEYNDEFFSELHFLTSTEPSGWEIENDGTSHIYINDKKANVIIKESNKYILRIDDESLSNFKSNFNKEDEKYSNQFLISFWLLFENMNDSDLLAEVNYTINDENSGKDKNKKSQVVISDTLGGAWQYVTIPIDLETTQSTLKNISIVINCNKNSSLDNTQILISDVRIKKESVKKIIIGSLLSGDNSNVKLEIGNKLYYYDNCEREIVLSPDFYITEADIIATYRSLYYSIKNNDLYYELFYCNKTKIKAVTYVSMFPFYLTDDIYIREKHKHFRFDFAEYDNNNFKILSNKPNYHLRLVDLISMQENKKSYRVTEIQRKIKEREDNRFTFETHTLIGIVEAENLEQRLNEENSVCSIIEENDDGTEISRKYTKEIYNNNNEIDKVITIITKNEYDEFGNIIKVVTQSDSSSEKILIEYFYYEEVPAEHEYLRAIKKNGNIEVAYYNENGSIDKIYYMKNKKYIDGNVEEFDDELIKIYKYIYNEFDNLINIKFYDKNNNMFAENTINYDRSGNLSTINYSNSSIYNYVFDANSRNCEIYKNKKLINRKIEKLSEINDTYNIYLYQGNNTYLTTEIFDKYGKIISSSTGSLIGNEIHNNNTVLYEYEDKNFKCSKYVERVSKITDQFSNKIYLFNYIDSENDGTTIELLVNNEYSIINKANNTEIFEVFNDNFKSKYSYENEDQMNENPKYSYNYFSEVSSENWLQNTNFSFDYEYDALGRLILKRGKNSDNGTSIINVEKKISYYENTNFPKEIRVDINSILKNETNDKACASLIYKNSYENGNIIKVESIGSRFNQIPNDLTSQAIENLDMLTWNYEYDDQNRLIKEKIPNGDIYIYEYGSESGMIEKVFKNNTLIKLLRYNAGRLTEIEENDKILFEYDNYGNMIKFGDTILSYNSRNLLKKYESDNNELLFEYNYQGVRTKKIYNNNYQVNYYLSGARIIGEDKVQIDTKEIINKFRYYYDAFGICGINYINDNKNYYFNLIKDSFGNISKVIFNGKLIGEYLYNAWGDCETIIYTSNSIEKYVVENNPFRYKAYYCDLESGLALISSRYYSPKIGIFIQPSNINCLNQFNYSGLNTYSYGENNPTSFVYDNEQIFIMMAGKGHQGNMKSNKYTYWTTEELFARLEELRKKGHLTSEEKKEKKEIETELKARGVRNKQKRKGYNRSKISLSPPLNSIVVSPNISTNNGIDLTPNSSMNGGINLTPNVEVNEEAVAATVGVVVVGGLITYVLANDATGVGVVDDFALVVLIPLLLILGG